MSETITKEPKSSDEPIVEEKTTKKINDERAKKAKEEKIKRTFTLRLLVMII